MKLKEAFEKVVPRWDDLDDIVKVVNRGDETVHKTHKEEPDEFGTRYIKKRRSKLPENLHDAEVKSVKLWAIDADMICAEFEI